MTIASLQGGGTAQVTGRRVAARARVALPATLESLSGTVNVILRNISETGAMLEVGKLPARGADAVLCCGELDCFGTIVWARSRWCGFAFDEPIPQEMVLRLRSASDSGQADAASRNALHDAARRWAEGGRGPEAN